MKSETSLRQNNRFSSKTQQVSLYLYCKLHSAAQTQSQNNLVCDLKVLMGAQILYTLNYNHAKNQPEVQRTAIRAGAAKQHTVGVLKPHWTC